MVDLEHFLAEQAKFGFVWGTTDCALLIADWVVANGLPDPAVALRGTYETEKQCQALVRSAGGLAQLLGDAVEASGMVKTVDPALGSVGVIGARLNSDRQWAAIWNGSDWVARWGDAIHPFKAQPLGIWSF